MSENRALRIHTQILPEQAAESPPSGKKRFKSRKHRPDRPAPKRMIIRAKPTATDRLLRNSTVACAVLLGVLTLSTIDQPWAIKASEGIEKALTMRIDLDETIGELTFVKELMPESALVFLNISGEDRLKLPVEGTAVHPWSEVQPWLMFECEPGTEVVAVQTGTVTAVSPLSGGKYGVLVDHGNGVESVYAHLGSPVVSPGDTVSRGQALAAAGGQLYFEWRSGGKSIDPAEALGL